MTNNNVSFGTNKFLRLDYVAVVIIVIAFFVISYCGFYIRDDYAMVLGKSPSLSDVLNKTIWFYFNLGGRYFSVFSQYLFSGWFDNKIWFDIVNALFFALLILVCGRLVNDGKKESIHYVLIFSLLFWALCPVPRETLFWVAGATTYLWACTLTFVFLLCFQKYKDDNFSIIGKTGLFLMSIVCATEFISCASICGAFVVYYIFHLKKFKGNVVPLVVGFAIGSMLVLFAPGNFLRVSIDNIHNGSFYERIMDTILHPVREMMKYKVLWILLIAIICGWIKNKVFVKNWARKNSILLLSLGWSVVAFSLVFTPVANRALFFPESISLVLLLRFLFDGETNYADAFMCHFSPQVKSVVIPLLFSVFLLDSAFAIKETRKQHHNNDRILAEIKEAKGVTGVDMFVSSHRMAYPPKFISWGWQGMAYKLGLDSVILYPYYCQDKYYLESSYGKNIYVDYQGLLSSEEDGMTTGDHGIIFIRLPYENKRQNQKEFSVTYTKKKKWYKYKQRSPDYNWNRTITIQREAPDTVFMNTGYYFIWMKKEDLNNLKKVDCKYE